MPLAPRRVRKQPCTETDCDNTVFVRNMGGVKIRCVDCDAANTRRIQAAQRRRARARKSNPDRVIDAAA
jgi:hypothetical protein